MKKRQCGKLVKQLETNEKGCVAGVHGGGVEVLMP